MKRYLTALIFLVLAPLSVFGQQPVPTPQISISANDATSLDLYQGWPLIVHMTIMNSLRLSGISNAPPLVLAPPGVAWTSAIQLQAVSSTGQTFTWPLTLVGTPSTQSLTLMSGSYIRLTWQMAGSDVAALTPDTYQLSATLSVANSSGWNGTIQSAPVTVLVEPEPSPLTPDLGSDKALTAAEYSLNLGDTTTAMNGLQQALTNQPNNQYTMAAAASILESQGNLGAAFFAANAALNAYYLNIPTPDEAPATILAMNQRLFTEMLTPNPNELQTNTTAASATIVYSPSIQTLTLNATVTAPGSAVNSGSVDFTISGLAGPVTSGTVTTGATSATVTIPAATPAGSYVILAVYNGASGFSVSSDLTKTLTIKKATPSVSWNAPSPLTAGTPLSSTQLNATASVPGVFVYTPGPNSILAPGSTDTLSVAFTPTDSTDYNTAAASVSVTVLPGSYSGSVSPTSATIKVGGSQTFNLNISSSSYQGPITLGCSYPPTVISCVFVPPQVNLTANMSSSVMLTMTVNSKPAAAVIISPNVSPNQPWRPLQIAILFGLFGFVFMIFGWIRGRQRPFPPFAFIPRRSFVLSVLIFLAIGLTSCQSGGNSASPGGSGGGPATANVVLQGNAGSTIVSLGTITVTVP